MVIIMKTAFAGFDLMAPAFRTLCEESEVVKLFTCAVDGDFETNSEVISLSREYGIPYTDARITPDDIEELIEMGCELLISAGYYYRIPVDDRLPMVNIHPSLLPYGRGAWPMPLAILDRLPESGVTVHKTEESFDTGDILLQERFSLAPDETLDSFMDKVNARIPAMIRALIADFHRLWQNARPQGEGVYLDEPDPEDYVLNRSSSPEVADRVLRAFRGFFAVYDDGKERHHIRYGRAFAGEISGKPYPIDGGYIEKQRKNS